MASKGNRDPANYAEGREGSIEMSKVMFEGGVRGGAVSVPETLPGQYPYPAKLGYDERRRRRAAGGTVHGVPGVEGMDDHGSTEAPSMGGGEEMSDSDGMDGYHCFHGCGYYKSKHGLARHTMARHGGFRGLGHAMTHGMKKHGSGLGPDVEKQGESESPANWKDNAARARPWSHSESKSTVADTCSSYSSGDLNGSYGRMKNVSNR